MSTGGKNIKRPILITAIVILCVVFCVSGGIVIFDTVRNVREDRAFDDLKKKLGPPAASSEAADIPDGAGEANTPADGENAEASAPESPVENPDAEEDISGRYDALYAENSDLFGWVTVDGTKIDYPVMYTPDDPEYYLHRSFEKKYSSSGVPFMDGDCYEGCLNYIIFGHHMRNGTMFAALIDYRNEDFWKEHKTVKFDTLKVHGEYEIISAFYSQVYHVDETGVFRWYNYTDLTDEAVYNEYIENVKKASRYDTGVTAEYGDELLTLSTCGKDNIQRFVVVAKKVK